tara:strand:- start:26884 stop:27588 length:705 start_codon:yes stop_codon:yes gene_type:complete
MLITTKEEILLSQIKGLHKRSKETNFFNNKRKMTLMEYKFYNFFSFLLLINFGLVLFSMFMFLVFLMFGSLEIVLPEVMLFAKISLSVSNIGFFILYLMFLYKWISKKTKLSMKEKILTLSLFQALIFIIKEITRTKEKENIYEIEIKDTIEKLDIKEIYKLSSLLDLKSLEGQDIFSIYLEEKIRKELNLKVEEVYENMKNSTLYTTTKPEVLNLLLNEEKEIKVKDIQMETE